MSSIQEELGNDCERTVLGASDPIDPVIYARELARYAWASEHIRPGMRVLELGCSTGFGTRLLPDGIDYTGVDYSAEVVAFAQDQFGTTGRPGRRFICSTIDGFLHDAVPCWDVIIAFEVLEHVPNGREVAQRLKQYADTVLITTPYREPVGFWGKHHVLHGLQERDFPQFAYRYMHMDGAVESFPTVEHANLLMMEWKRGELYPERSRVLCSIPTRDRPDALMQVLQAVAFQTRAPEKVIIYDDGAHADIREHPIGRYILPLLKSAGIDWEVVFTPGRGQHIAHQLANGAGYDFVWRLDDDTVPEPDVLERLLAHMTEGVGAVGGAVYELARPMAGGYALRIEHFFGCNNVQWAPDQGTHEVDFLYSSFLYRPGIVDYKHNMSPAAFHEETIFTHRLKRAGYRLIADTSIRTHHMRQPTGGTRAADLEWAYAWDRDEFLRVMADEFGVKLIHLGVGLGDNFAFLNILPELQQRYRKIVLGSVFPDVFAGDDVVVIPYDKAKQQASENVYDWMAEHQWEGHIIDAYRAMYL